MPTHVSPPPWLGPKLPWAFKSRTWAVWGLLWLAESAAYHVAPWLKPREDAADGQSSAEGLPTASAISHR
jgi:hypothetical protein